MINQKSGNTVEYLLADYGISKNLNDKSTDSECLYGESRFMAPEMLDIICAGDEEMVDSLDLRRVDVYALGLSLVELYTG